MISRIESKGNTVYITGQFVLDQLRRISAALYQMVQKQGYQDVVLDFADCTVAKPGPMIGLCAEIVALRSRGIDTSVVPPTLDGLRRLFYNSGWAYTLDPENNKRSAYRGVRNLPVTQFATQKEQHELVNKFMLAILSAMDGLERDDLKAIEWSINEITDNVLVHAQSDVGGFVQLSNFPTKGTVEIVVADAGVGIPRTLREHFPHLTDSQLLEQATKEGITRDPQLGQGNGLFGTFSVASASGGTFQLLSGNGSLRFEKQELRLTNEKVPYPGTLVMASFDTRDKDVLSTALKFGNVQYVPLDFVSFRYEVDDSEDLIFRMHEEAESTGSRLSGTPVRMRLRNLILMHPGRRIRVDLSQVPILSSSFADEVFAKLFRDIGPLAFATTVELTEVTPIVRQLIDRAIVQRMRLPNE